MKLNEVIRNYRQNNQLSLRAFAEKCGISFGYLSMLENQVQPTTGKPIVPSLTTLNRIASGLGITLTDLLNILDNEQTANSIPNDMIINSPDEKHLIEAFRVLDDSKKEALFSYIDNLL